jgi:hypothetical protein
MKLKVLTCGAAWLIATGILFNPVLGSVDRPGGDSRTAAAQAARVVPTRPAPVAQGLTNLCVDTIYAETLAPQWQVSTWDCQDGITTNIWTLTEQGVAASGTNAIRVAYTCPGGYGGFGFDRRTVDWTTLYLMYMNQYRFVGFDIYCPDATTDAMQGLQLTLDLANAPTVAILDRISPALQPHQWSHVRIPLADCNPDGLPFDRIFFFNNSLNNPTILLDNITLEWGPDNTPPVIGGVTVSNLTWNTATVGFTTDEYTSATLSLTAPGAPAMTATLDTFARSAAFTVTNLAPDTTYEFQITAGDHQIGSKAPNTSTYSGSISTLATNIAPVLTGLIVTNVHAESAGMRWTTALPSDSEIDYGLGDYSLTYRDPAYTTVHEVTLTGLIPASVYNFRVISHDPYGNEARLEENPPMQFTTATPPVATLRFDAAKPGRPFTRNILGANLLNTTYYWGRPYPNDSPKLRELTRLIKPGVLRHAGGLLSNHVLWDRSNHQFYPANGNDQRMFLDPAGTGTNYDANGVATLVPATYQVAYQADEIDNVAAFAAYVGADVMLEVNVLTADPAMWADLVHYANVEHHYGFRYWELGNELDNEYAGGLPSVIGADYVERYRRYTRALRAVDPGVLITGPATAAYEEDGYFQAFTRFIDPLTLDPEVLSGRMLDALSIHYYPRWNGAGPVSWSDMFLYGAPDDASARQFASASMQRKRALLDQRGFTNAIVAVTEFDAIAADAPTKNNLNHANALFMADMLPRLASGGADIVCHWDLFDWSSGPGASNFGLIDNANAQASIDGQGHFILVNDAFQPNPVYYAYFMLAQLFGDRLIASTSSAPDTVSFWAASNSANPSVVTALAVNFNGESVRASLDFGGATPESVNVWTLANPDFVNAADKNIVMTGTTINGLKIDATSAESINTSARAILDSPAVVTPSGATLDRLLPPYSATLFSVSTGSLRISQEGTQARLAWPASWTTGVLQVAEAPGGPWLPVSGTPQVEGSQSILLEPLANGPRFYRITFQ